MKNLYRIPSLSLAASVLLLAAAVSPSAHAQPATPEHVTGTNPYPFETRDFRDEEEEEPELIDLPEGYDDKLAVLSEEQLEFLRGPDARRFRGDEEKMTEYFDEHTPEEIVEWVSAMQRLGELNAVQNTYLNTFQVLGGLGLLLGSLGLGVVVMRNVQERKSELALLRAIGFEKRTIKRFVLGEYLGLLMGG